MAEKKNSLTIEKQIKRLRFDLRDKMRKQWKRVLPFNELIADRWEKAHYLGFGKKTSVYDSCFVRGDVRVGENTWIGPFTMLDGTGGIRIGSHCSVSTGVQIYSHDSVRWALSGGKADYDYAAVQIGDCCYIGPNAVIAKGVKIGRHCVIGAGSFVNQSLPDYSIAFGIPARVVGRVVMGKDGNISFKYKAQNKRKN